MPIRFVFSLLFLAAFCGDARADVTDSVVRVISHGGSATVISVANGRSYLLSCGHLFETAADVRRPLRIDAPDPSVTSTQPFRIENRTEQIGTTRKVGVRLLAHQFSERPDLDLSLIEVGAELPFVAPVAPIGFRSAGEYLSAGYDSMTPGAPGRPQVYVAHGLRDEGAYTYTRERPRPGRSGGGLIDKQTGYLCGVCSGYETTGPRRGKYASLAQIHLFLQKKGYGALIGGAGQGGTQYSVPSTHQSPLTIAATPQAYAGANRLWWYQQPGDSRRAIFDGARQRGLRVQVGLRNGQVAECRDIDAGTIIVNEQRLTLADFGAIWTGEARCFLGYEAVQQAVQPEMYGQQPYRAAPAQPLYGQQPYSLPPCKT